MKARQRMLLVLLAVATGCAGCNYKTVVVEHPPLFMEEDAVPLAPYLGQWRYVHPPPVVAEHGDELADVTLDIQARADACSVVVATSFQSPAPEEGEEQYTYGDIRLMRVGDKVLGVEEVLDDQGELERCYVFEVRFFNNEHNRLALLPLGGEFIKERIITGALEGTHSDALRFLYVKVTTDATRFRQFLEENIGDHDMFPVVTIVLERIPAQ